MPDRMQFGAAFSQLCGNRWPEMIDPTADCLVRNDNSALREQILDVAEAQREPYIEPNRLLNDLGRETVSGAADFRHFPWLPCLQGASKPRDKASPKAESSNEPRVKACRHPPCSRRRPPPAG